MTERGGRGRLSGEGSGSFLDPAAVNSRHRRLSAKPPLNIGLGVKSAARISRAIFSRLIVSRSWSRRVYSASQLRFYLYVSSHSETRPFP